MQQNAGLSLQAFPAPLQRAFNSLGEISDTSSHLLTCLERPLPRFALFHVLRIDT